MRCLFMALNPIVRNINRGMRRTARSVFSERSLKVVCFLQRSWYTCARLQQLRPGCPFLLASSVNRALQMSSLINHSSAVQTFPHSVAQGYLRMMHGGCTCT